MDRWMLFLIVAAAAGAWVFYTRVLRKKPFAEERYSQPLPDVENWYSSAMEKIEAVGAEFREEIEAGWRALSDKEKMAFSEKFMLEEFDQRALTGYNRQHRLKIGLARYLINEIEKSH